MNEVTFTKNELLAGALAWWSIFLVLSVTEFNAGYVLTSVGFFTLVLLPGLLTQGVLRMKLRSGWGVVAVAIGFSLLELMLVGFGVNEILPFVGIAAPLMKIPILVSLTIFIFILALIGWYRMEDLSFTPRRFVFFNQTESLVMALIPFVFVLMSALGAVSLNNQGGNILTVLMLGGVAVYLAVLVWRSSTLEEGVIPMALFGISLALLLMTSLRGWYVTGHDIQREYRVFQLAKHAGVWDISAFKDAYNACISITILPTIFSNLLKFFDPYVYKILYQILFAVVPGVLFITLRKYVAPAIALLSVVYFISFPTFFGDMPFLNRQEIAFIFLALMGYLIFTETHLPRRLTQVLFVLFGIGIVLSHYSTTYTIVALLVFVLIARPLAYAVGRFCTKRNLFQKSAFRFMHAPATETRYITVWVVAVIAGCSFLWSSILTDTSSNSLYRVLSETWKVVVDNTKDDAKSGDVLYNLFSWRKAEPHNTLEEYRKAIEAKRVKEPRSYYEDFSFEKYPTVLAPETVLPPTRLGSLLEYVGVDVYDFNYYFRQISAKLLQVFVIVGFIALLFRHSLLTVKLPTEYVLLAAGSMCMILSQVVLPVLSVEYGLLRAFQQSLMYLGVFVAVGTVVFSRVAFGKKYVMHGATVLAIIFLLSTTGFITQMVGRYAPQLHLTNGGTYYDVYYIHKTDVFGMEWLVHRIHSDESPSFQAQAQTDRLASTRVQLPKNGGLYTDINPGVLRKDAFVYLNQENSVKEQVTISYSGDLLSYKFPIEFIDAHKDLIYSNGTSRVYR